MAPDAGDFVTRDSGPRTELGAKEFALVADVLREAFEPLGFSVYVSSNVHSIGLTEKGYVGGGECDFHVKVRVIPHDS